MEESVKKNVWIGKTYNKLLRPPEEQYFIQLSGEREAKNTYWMYGIVLSSRPGLDAREVMKRLSEKKEI